MAGVTGAQCVPGCFVLIQCHFRIGNLIKIMHTNALRRYIINTVGGRLYVPVSGC